ncbi:hypothetical protein Y1Q_0017355 [Alligator mississippiensis]|uniref:Uncharacterized protein n=1 Tax=Alligator mississippiensis TaxID=8496 RepID=A0A151NGT7_ALLMI|nr:hypothetical protein Y1Q_0017355 [Alligator mississippiensis]
MAGEIGEDYSRSEHLLGNLRESVRRTPLIARTKAACDWVFEIRWSQIGALARNLRENPGTEEQTIMQPAAMAPSNLLSQNLQALTQIVDAQQQIMECQCDWLRHGLTAFKMPKMTNDDDPEAYIEAFERHAIMMGLDKGYWASQLGALVVGKAQAAYRALSHDEAWDYEGVKAAILYQLEINPEHYRRLFRAKKGAEERRPWLLLLLLRELFGKD